IDTLLASGGLSKNSLFIQEHVDIIGCSINQPRESEWVLLDVAILGVVAAKKYLWLREAMKELNVTGMVCNSVISLIDIVSVGSICGFHFVTH
nr:FGGY carbohydrate kinase domain-containing protein isoform X2 [Tanacetum cinerariifolium]